MNSEIIVDIPYVHPVLQTPLELVSEGLKDPKSGSVFPVVREIPRFCTADNYSESFGFQWNRFDRTQLDIHSGADQSFQRFYGETDWTSDDLNKCAVLEVGSGAGRFSEVFLRTTQGVLYSVDYSSAVDANKRNNGQYGDRLRLVQASIYEMPFSDNSFDRVFCFGVLQHTPSFEGSVAALISKAKPGGEIVVDFYPIKGWYTKIHSKYMLRPLTKRMPRKVLLKIIRLNISWMILLFDTLCFFRLGILTRFIPMTDIRSFPSNLTPKQRREWAVMDTFDAFSPEYDNPQRIEAVARMFAERGCVVKFAGLAKYSGGESAVVRAIKEKRAY